VHACGALARLILLLANIRTEFIAGSQLNQHQDFMVTPKLCRILPSFSCTSASDYPSK
jgi:hypothetical protein